MHKNYLPIYDDGRCVLFALGRNAMYAACLMMKLGQGDEVLTPAFDCDGALQPFRVLGCELRFYRSDPHTFSVDIGDIKRRITPRTKLLHIVNHFGMPQPWNDLACLRRETGIPILEDNAYSLFSRFQDKAFGTFGDMSIFSIRKNLPVIDGGLLRINNPRYANEVPRKDPKWIYPTEWGAALRSVKSVFGEGSFAALLKRAARRCDPASAPPPPLYSDSKDGYPVWPARDRVGRDFSCDYVRPMSRWARMQLEKFSESDYSEIAEKKRCYYAFFSNRLKDIKGIRILWPELPDGIVPFCLSCMVSRKRDVLLEQLRLRYDVMAWPTLSKLVLDRREEFPEVGLLGRTLLQINLPVDRVRSPEFARHAGRLVSDIYAFSEKHLSHSSS